MHETTHMDNATYADRRAGRRNSASGGQRAARALLLAACSLLGSCGGESLATAPTACLSQHACSVLFVGDSFTHGRYVPVRTFNAQQPGASWSGPPQVIDENYGRTDARAELESGPWGGIPGIFSELAQQMHMNYEVHIEAISATSLEKNFAAASDVIARPGWQAVVLQELSVKPLPRSLTQSALSDPPAFSKSVHTIEQAVHAIAPATAIYLYEPWPRADLARQLAGNSTQAEYHDRYMDALHALGAANLASYDCAAQLDGNIAAVAPVGEAWRRAWDQGVANPDPYQPSTLPDLWYGIDTINDPPISLPDYLHPSVYGAYLSGLVLFSQITGTDVRPLGATELAAGRLGIPGQVAVRLQQQAWETVRLREQATMDPGSCLRLQPGAV